MLDVKVQSGSLFISIIRPFTGLWCRSLLNTVSPDPMQVEQSQRDTWAVQLKDH